jgi:hypothetical protein
MDNSDVAAALVSLTKQVQRLTRLIEGEGNGGIEFSRGIVGELQDLDDADTAIDGRLVKVEKEWSRFKWVIIGAATGGGVAGGVSFDLINRAVGG